MVTVIKYKRIIIMSLVIISVLFGMYIYSRIDNINTLITNTSSIKYINYNTILIHVLILSISFLLSFTGIGIILLIMYLLFEGITIGFMILHFITIYKTSGIIYSILYILIFKFVIVFLIMILIIKFIKIFKNIISKIKGKQVDITKTVINCFVLIISLISYDFILLLFGTKLLNIFIF